MSNPIPQAAIAPPLPKPAKSPFTRYAAAGAAALAVFGCLAFSCGAVVMYSFVGGPRGGDGGALPAVPGAVADRGAKPVADPGAKPVEQWGFQDLQDYLANKGLKTSRMHDRGEMLFSSDDPEIIRGEGGIKHDIIFSAKQFETGEEARKEARRIMDVEQREVLCWSRFVFTTNGYPAALKRLKQILP